MRMLTSRSILVLPLLAPVVASLRLPPIAITPHDAITSVCIFACGDVVSQQIEKQSSAPKWQRGSLAARPLPVLEARRTGSAAVLGAIYGGVMLPFVYQLAEGLFPGVSARNVVLKVLVSCGLLSTFGNYFSLSFRRFVQPSPGEGAWARLKRTIASVNADMWGVLKADVRVWPLYDIITFSLIPPHRRPFATAIVSVCWHTYVAFVAAATCAASPESPPAELGVPLGSEKRSMASKAA